MKKIITIILLIINLTLFANAKENLDFGKGMFKSKLYSEAIQALNVILNEYPTSDEAEEALYYIGESNKNLNRFAEAEKHYRLLYDGYPNSKYKSEALMLMAKMQFLQRKYGEAGENFSHLITKFPKTDLAKEATFQTVQSYYFTEDYVKTIDIAQKLIKNYPNSKNNSEIYLLIARSYFAMNMTDEANIVLEKIKKDFSNFDARWKAEEITIDQKLNKEGIEAAKKAYKKLLKEDVPRNLKAKFQINLAKLYLKTNDNIKAASELENVIKRYSNHDDMDKIIIEYFSSLDKNKDYNKILANQEDNQKYFKNSDLKSSYELFISKAQIITGKFDEAQRNIDQIILVNDSIRFESNYLKALLAESRGSLTESINLYTNIINKYAIYGRNELILMRLGDIYLQKLKKFNGGIKYFQQVIAISSNFEQKAIAQIKIAECYENLNDFDNALNELYQIDLENVENLSLRDKVIKKQAYLREFFKKDYESAFESLLTSLYKNELTSPAQMQTNLLDILIYDLKNYERVLELLSTEKTSYKLGYIQLKLAQKNKLEGNINSYKTYLQEARQQIIALGTINEENSADLAIRAQMVESDSLTSSIQGGMIAFINQYPDNPTSHFFRSTLGNVKDIPNDLLLSLLTDLQKVREISKQEFYLGKLKLAEILFERKDFVLANENYKLTSHLLNLSRPTAMMHYAESLIYTGDKDNGYKRLEFIVKNTENFPEFSKAIDLLRIYFSENNDFETAIKYYLKYPELEKKDTYYLNLSSLYLSIGKNEAGKTAIMHIKKKSLETLKDLAQLHIDTGDYKLAVYTYNELLKKDKKDEQFYLWNLGHIAYLADDFKLATKHYSKLTAKTNRDKKLNWVDISKETIISYLRIENRPKADSIAKKFKSTLKDQVVANLEIDLSRGIYYKNLDLKKSEKILTKVLNDENATESIKAESFYWRGVSRLENKDMDKALSDFKNVLKKENPKYHNDAQLKLGTIYFSKEQFQDALKHYYIVIENDDKGDLAHSAARNYAYVCKTMHEWDKAITAYEIILERWGDKELQGDTVFDIAFCYYRDKNYQKAVPMFEKAIQLLDDRTLQSEAQYWIGESYFGMDSYNEAVLAFLKVGFQYSDQKMWAGISELKAGESYLKMQQIETAKKILQRVIKTYGPGSEPGSQAKKILNTL